MSIRIRFPLTLKFNAENLVRSGTKEDVKKHICLTLSNVINWLKSGNPNSILNDADVTFRYIKASLDPIWVGHSDFMFEATLKDGQDPEKLKRRIICEITAHRDRYLLGILCTWTSAQFQNRRKSQTKQQCLEHYLESKS
tara:strand:- start:35 stop:454 length:420 start_codon:yes stop_codon:yes gene_type:complete